MPVKGSPAHAILACAEAGNAELIVVGTNRRKGPERLLCRGVALEILREAECDILVVPAPDDPKRLEQ